MARDLTQVLPWLDGTAGGRLEPGLRRFVHCRVPWTARDVVDAVDDVNRRLGRASMTRRLVKNPPALLASYLRNLDVDADHPRGFLDPTVERTPPLTRTQEANQQRREAHTARQAAAPPPPEWEAVRRRLREPTSATSALGRDTNGNSEVHAPGS